MEVSSKAVVDVVVGYVWSLSRSAAATRSHRRRPRRRSLRGRGRRWPRRRRGSESFACLPRCSRIHAAEPGLPRLGDRSTMRSAHRSRAIRPIATRCLRAQPRGWAYSSSAAPWIFSLAPPAQRDAAATALVRFLEIHVEFTVMRHSQLVP